MDKQKILIDKEIEKLIDLMGLDLELMTLCQCNGAPVSQHGGNSSTTVSMNGNSIVRMNKPVSGGPVPIAVAMKKPRDLILAMEFSYSRGPGAPALSI